MPSWSIPNNEVEGLKEEAAELGSYSVHIVIVLSLVFSLMAVAIISKRQVTHQFFACLVAFVIPMPVALYFRNRIVLFGVFTYIAALVIALIAVILFGI